MKSLAQVNKHEIIQMPTLTIEDIEDRANGKRTTLAYTREINRLLRKQDQSHLWPVLNKFNATNRAIRRCRAASSATGTAYTAYDVGREIGLLVNA